jgi:hypothetical protein
MGVVVESRKAGRGGGVPGHLTEFGKMAEMYVVRELRRRGFDVEWVADRSDYDVVINGKVRGEIKGATRSNGSGNGRQDRWQFSLRRHGLPLDEELLFLLCYEDALSDPITLFIIPGDALHQSLSKIDITSHDPVAYRGKWTRYREDWSQVARMVRLAPPAAQPSLFRFAGVDIIPF